MTEFIENPSNLRPDGKRRWKPRKGLTDPKERMEELREESERHANEVLPPGPPLTNRVIVQRDLPLDASDRVDESLKNRSGK